MRNKECVRSIMCLKAAIEVQSSRSRMEGKEKLVSDWRGYGSDTIDEAVASGRDLSGVLPRFYGHLVKAHNGPGGVSWHSGGDFQRSTSVKRWRCLMRPASASARSRRTWGFGATVLGRWRRELRRGPAQAFAGHGRPRDEELTQLRRELSRVTKERDVLREAATFFASASR